MSTYVHVHQIGAMLGNLDAWLAKAVESATARSFDPNVLVDARLAPDQYPLVRQVQAACDSAKYVAARLTGKEAPAHPDEERTMAELRARIEKVRGFLGSFAEKDFEGAEKRKISLPFLPEGKGMLGEGYLASFALPNFYFHVAHAYAILRHNGVALGKRDYIGAGISLVDL